MINIEDRNLIYYLQTILNKKNENINLDDFKKIKILNFDSIYFMDGTENRTDFSVLTLFPNLEEINIFNTVLSNEDLEYIKSASILKLHLTRCTFNDNVDYSLMSKISKLTLYNSYIENYNLLLSRLENIESLEIINPYDENEIDINDITVTVKNLILDKCIIKNIDAFKKLEKCEILSLLGTYLNDSDLSFFRNMKELKKLYVSENYLYDDRLDFIKDKVEIKGDPVEMVLDGISL